jgi:hypothetical protein
MVNLHWYFGTLKYVQYVTEVGIHAMNSFGIMINIYNLVTMSASITNHECTLRHYSKQSEVMSLHDQSNKTPAER